MSSSALSKFANFHQELFLHASQAAQSSSDLHNQDIAGYSKNFMASIPATKHSSHLDEIVSEAEKANIVFFGDFHTLKQSQKGFLDILEAIHKQHPTKPLVVALEIFKASDQKLIDEYLSGFLDESHFLRAIDYKNSWGFPWDHYRPIIDFCSLHKVKVLGINSQFDNDNRLSKRDDFAGSILNSWLKENPDNLCLCLIGEYHLADNHLISRISSDKKILRIIANVDQIALEFASKTIASPEYFKLSDNFYCVINTAPWIKWNSLTMWEELHHATDANFYQDDTELYTEHHYDYDYHLLHMAKSINNLLDLGISSSQLSQFDLYMRPDRSTFLYLKNKLKISRHEFLAADRILQREGFYYFSPARTMVIQNYSIHKFAELAGHFLFDCLVPNKGSESFIRRVESQICATISALLMNPRKSTVRISELEAYYETVKRRRLIGESKMRREAVKCAIPLFYELAQDRHIPKSVTSEHLAEKDRELGYLASRILGELVGIHVFESLIAESAEVGFSQIKQIFHSGLEFHISLLSSQKDRAAKAS